jgi:hypothetical protein
MQFQYAPGHLVILLQTIVQDTVDIAIRQVAAIHFKNLVGKEWEAEDGEGTSHRAFLSQL